MMKTDDPTPMLEAYSERLLKREEKLKDRIRFLDTLPQNKFPHDRYPNTLPYNVTFQEMTDIDDMQSDIHDFLGRYISKVCLVCGEIVGLGPYRQHHISYYPETIIPVHHKCHDQIHHTGGYPYLKRYLPGDSKDFYNGVKKPARWIESGIPENEIKSVRSALASCYPRPNLNWNRAATTEVNIEYEIVYRKG